MTCEPRTEKRKRLALNHNRSVANAYSETFVDAELVQGYQTPVGGWQPPSGELIKIVFSHSPLCRALAFTNCLHVVCIRALFSHG